jgi:hypothetical protein
MGADRRDPARELAAKEAQAKRELQDAAARLEADAERMEHAEEELEEQIERAKRAAGEALGD